MPTTETSTTTSLRLPFDQVDVFTSKPFRGNPVAVIHGADGLSTDQMREIAIWTNLSETTFLLEPTSPEADYRVRIFSLSQELPFAGHPTLGTCHAWLSRGGMPSNPRHIVQECDLGLIPIRSSDERLAFAAPPRIRQGPVDDADLDRVVTYLGISKDDVVDSAWCDNGPGWIGVMLDSADAVNALNPTPAKPEQIEIGVIGPTTVTGEGGAERVAYEVRAFFCWGNAHIEDPVTGSLNAALAQWLFESDKRDTDYVAAQGTTMGRSGRVFIERDGGEIWVGGHTVTCVDGTISI